jgi:hypothetical protein
VKAVVSRLHNVCTVLLSGWPSRVLLHCVCVLMSDFLGFFSVRRQYVCTDRCVVSMCVMIGGFLVFRLKHLYMWHKYRDNNIYARIKNIYATTFNQSLLSNLLRDILCGSEK